MPNQFMEEVTSEEFIQSLPHAKSCNGKDMYLYDGVWYQPPFLKSANAFRKHFKARNDDVFLITFPKCGTTWLMALISTVVHRCKQPLSSAPTLFSHPHNLIPVMEVDMYKEGQDPAVVDDERKFPSPRILATHLPLAALPTSVVSSTCRIVYCCRNPLDQFVSCYLFLIKHLPSDQDPSPIEEAFEIFLNGVQDFGPFWDQMLGYWNLSLTNPERVLFLRYEELKKDINGNLKKLAEFLGFPFTDKEMEEGVVEEIAKLCSFERLKNLEVNKGGTVHAGAAKSETFFRKGEVGDWVNHISPAMALRSEQMWKEKFGDSGLEFEVFGEMSKN